MAAVAVVGAGWFTAPHSPDKGLPSTCDPRKFRAAEVDLRVQVAVAGLDYPRITSDVRITMPRAVPGAESLLAGSAGAHGRTAFACLLGRERSPFEVRDSPSGVVLRDGVVVVTHRSTTDVAHRATTDIEHQSTAWADFTSIEKIDTTGRPWRLAVDASACGSPPGRSRCSPRTGGCPHRNRGQSAKLDGSELQWPRSVPAASRDGATGLPGRVRRTAPGHTHHRHRAGHRPDAQALHLGRVLAVGADLLPGRTVARPRASGPGASFESAPARRARQAVRPLPHLVVLRAPRR